MPAARLTSTKDLIVVSADGRLNLSASEAALEEMLADLQREPGRNVVLDLRSAQCDFSLSEVYNLVNFLAAHSSQRNLYRRIAVLIASAAHQQRASFFALCAGNRDIEVKTFTAVQDVENWLGSDASRLLSRGQ